MLFTTSWDDGYQLDLRVADALTRHGATGTFYVCPQSQHGDVMLTPEDIQKISREHEVGAHTLTHPKLTRISLEDARREIEGSKQWVEELIQKPCTMFCYPKGDESPAIQDLVRQAGYLGARTVEQLRFDAGNDPYRLPTTLHITHFPWRKEWTKWWHPLDPLGPLRVKYGVLRKKGIPLRHMGSWLSLAQSLFSHALTLQNPVFHLWGHSSEIERYGLWRELDQFLAFVSSHREVKHVTNTQLIAGR